MDGLEQEYELPKDFKERVLKRLSLYPVDYGCTAWRNGEADGGALILGVDAGSSGIVFVAFPMEDADIEAITYKAEWLDPIAESRVHFAETTLAVLSALDIRLKGIIFDRDSQRRHLARGIFRIDSTESEIGLESGDALCLAACAHAQMYVDEAVIDEAKSRGFHPTRETEPPISSTEES